MPARTATTPAAATPLERTQQALDQATNIEFVDTPLKDVIDELARQHRLPIRLLRETYEAGYVLPDQPITRRFRKISLRSVLNLLLDPLQLDYRVTDQGEILIIAAEDRNKLPRRPVSAVQAAAAERHRQVLEQKIITLEFVDTPFKEVIAWIADEVEVPFVIDAAALDAVSLQPDGPVTINLQKMPLHRALTGFLYPLDLDVELRDEVFIVTKRNPLKPRRPIPDDLKRAARAPVAIELDRPELRDALAACADQADVTIVIDHRIDQIGVTPEIRVIGPIPKMPLRAALQRILEPIGLQAKVIDEILFIVPQPGFVRGVTLPARTQRILDQNTIFEFVDTPHRDVFAYLSNQHLVPIRMTPGAQGGLLSGSYPLTWNLRDISLRSALNLMLDPHGLDYTISAQGEILIVAREPSAAKSRPQQPVSTVQQAANERNRRIMERKLVTLAFVDTPLKDVFSYLADEIGVPFVFDEQALAVAILTVDFRMTRNLQEMPLQRALTACLYEYGLDVEPRNEVFYITLRDPRKPPRPIPPELKQAAQTPVRMELRNPELKDALESLAQQADVYLRVDHRIERAGVKSDTKVTGPLAKMPLRDALQKILEPLGLQAKVIDEVLFITTKELAK